MLKQFITQKLFPRERRRKILSAITPFLSVVVVWILYLLSRHRFHITQDVKDENIIGAFWHGEVLMLPFFYKKIKKVMKKERMKDYYIIASGHFDANIIADLCQKFGLKILRGSTDKESSRGGLKVLLESLRLLKEGHDIGIAPDGPRGPYHSIGDGVIAMSKKTKKRIIPMRVVYSRYWELKTWDRFRIPKPFCTIDFYALDGIVIDEKQDIESAKKQLQALLEQDVQEYSYNATKQKEL